MLMISEMEHTGYDRDKDRWYRCEGNCKGPIRGGTIGTKIDFLKVFKWILLWFQYIRPGKKEFLNLVTVLNLHIDHQHFENHYVRVKNQSCRKLYIWVSKPIRRKIQNQRKKLELNRTYQSREKSRKPPEGTGFLEPSSFGWFLGFFSWLVSPIEL